VLDELKALLRLAAPIVAAQVGMNAMGIVDTLVAGRLGEEALAALALGNVVYFGFIVVGAGTLMSLDSAVSNAFGAGDLPRCRRWHSQGVFLALGLAPILIALMQASTQLLLAIGYPPGLVARSQEYLDILVWGVPFAVLVSAYRSFVSAVDRAKILLVSALLANIANAVLDVWLTRGGLGVPPQGVLGIAWSTVFCRGVLLAPLVWLVHIAPSMKHFGPGLWRPHWPDLRHLLKVGIPAGLQFGAEVGTFGVAALFMGALGDLPLAAHQVALSFVSLIFMVPLGLGAAAAVRAGQAVGRRDGPGVRRAGVVAIGTGAVWSLFGMAILLLFPRPIAAGFGLTGEAFDLAVALLGMAVLFQLVDNIQIVANGVLRGLADTRAAFLLVLAGHGLLAIPVAWFGGPGHFGEPRAIWLGLTLGLTANSITLAVRFWKRSGEIGRELA